MAIIIPKNKLTREQYIKLFSNPVSGIACDFDKCYPDEIEYAGLVQDVVNNDLSKIRYSKSMIYNALDFWYNQYHKYYMKLWRMRKPFVDVSGKIFDILQELGTRMELVRNCPDSFLFSHRHIKELDVNHYRKYGGHNLAYTNQLLNKKYEDIIVNNGFRPQVGTLDPYMPVMSSATIGFTIFANEHPYIPRQKINKVGMTEKGNLYVLHKKKQQSGSTNKSKNNNGAKTNTPKKDTTLYNKDIAQSTIPQQSINLLLTSLMNNAKKAETRDLVKFLDTVKTVLD